MKVRCFRSGAFLLRSLAVLFAMLFALSLCRGADAAEPLRKADLDHFFAKLEKGQPVTVAAIGGSITMHRTGWAPRTVDKIREAYPQAQVNFVNAGISGTGSNFGVFRLQRDVSSVRPDLVFIEYVVNDGSVKDEVVIRNLESMVAALRSLPEPPAIVFVQSASSYNAKSTRHDLVAAHYDVLAVNTQQEVATILEKSGGEWATLFKDAVHPSEAGHQVYADAIWREMLENQQLPERTQAGELLPERLSADELILNGTLIAPNFQMNGWTYRDEAYHTSWLGRYFLGTLQNGADAGALNIPFYGRTVGVSLLTREGSGSVRIAVDGVLLDEIPAGRDWFYGMFVYPQLLEERWHVLSLIPVGDGEQPAKIRVAFLLGENQELAPAIPDGFWSTDWVQSLAQVDRLSRLRWTSVPVADWLVAGPFGVRAERAWDQPQVDLDRDYGIDPAAAVDMSAVYEGMDGVAVRWQAGSGSEGWVDLGKEYGMIDRGVAYGAVRIEAPESGEYIFRVAVDYFAYIYVNAEHVMSVLEPHGAAGNYLDVTVPLKKGVNEIVLKVHAGSQGLGFSMQYPYNEGLTIVKPQQ